MKIDRLKMIQFVLLMRAIRSASIPRRMVWLLNWLEQLQGVD